MRIGKPNFGLQQRELGFGERQLGYRKRNPRKRKRGDRLAERSLYLVCIPRFIVCILLMGTIALDTHGIGPSHGRTCAMGQADLQVKRGTLPCHSCDCAI